MTFVVVHCLHGDSFQFFVSVTSSYTIWLLVGFFFCLTYLPFLISFFFLEHLVPVPYHFYLHSLFLNRLTPQHPFVFIFFLPQLLLPVYVSLPMTLPSSLTWPSSVPPSSFSPRPPSSLLLLSLQFFSVWPRFMTFGSCTWIKPWALKAQALMGRYCQDPKTH